MAGHSLFGFLFLFCYFQLLLSAAAEGGDHVECGRTSQCGYLGNISFPFTTDDKPECGFPIRGCGDNDAEKEISLGSKHYKIESIRQKDNSILIYAADIPSEFHPESDDHQPEIRFSFNRVTFFGSCHSSPCESMTKYRNCSDYDIYFTSIDSSTFPIFPFACLPLGPFPPHHCSRLISLLEIRVELFHPTCNYCFHEGSSCRLNTTDFTCLDDDDDDFRKAPQPPLSHPYVNGAPPGDETKHNERGFKAATIGLSIGLATVIVIALLLILALYNRRVKSSGVQYQSRSIYHGLSRYATNPESGAVYFGIPVFSYEMLLEATNNFDQARELGEGGFGTVYYGKLGDGREVAVKRLFERNYRPVESFTNEIQILTRMRHRNLVSLYGCTSRHSRELLLVYEYVPNGTVSCHLHGDKAKHGSLPWPVRMKIAIETASALTYLHASDVIHRDVKTSNILLDNNFCVKVADFGLSRLYPDDVTHVSTAPRGTPGYVDPEYRLCYQLTSKSDVYSFGVVLVELISSLPAVDMTRDRDEIKLANLAIRKIQRRAFGELVDPSLGFQSDEGLTGMIISVAELAFQCLQGDKESRPSMCEVLEVLQRIESGKDEPGNLEGFDVHGASRATQSYAHPSLPNSWMTPQRHHQTL